MKIETNVNMRIAFLNIHGLSGDNSRENILVTLMKRHNIDILGVAETWAHQFDFESEEYKVLINIPARRNITGGRRTDGMCVVSKKYIHADVIEYDYNYVIIKVKSYNIWYLYCRPTEHKSLCVQFDVSINEDKSMDYVILGDFNISNSPINKRILDDVLFSKNIYEIPLHTYTYRSGRITSTPDRIYSNMLGKASAAPYDHYISDHRMIVFTISAKNTDEKPKYAYARLKDKQTALKIQKEIMVHTVQMRTSVDMHKISIDSLYSGIENCIAKGMVRLKRKTSESRLMMPVHIRTMITQRNRIRRDPKRNLEQLRTLRALIKREIRKFKTEGYLNAPKSPTVVGNCHEISKIMRSTTGHIDRNILTEEEMTDV